MIKNTCQLWHDVLEVRFDGHLAPEPGSEETIKDEEVKRIYFDALEFFKRTYFTDNMVRILEDVVEAFTGEGSKRTFAVTSLFGGGKSHTLLSIMHAFKSPDAIRDIEVLSFYDSDMASRLTELAKKIGKLEDVKVIVINGKYEISGGMSPLTPATLDGQSIKTVWGYLAVKLGEYQKLKKYDEDAVVPGADILTGILSGKKVLILIDEILEPTIKLPDTASGYKKQVLQFIEYLTKAIFTADGAMIVTLPFDVQAGEVRRYDGSYSREYVDQLYGRLKDIGEFVPPIGVTAGDLSKILKRRLFREIELNSAKRYVRELSDTYANYPDIFGKGDYAKRTWETYPFHPETVEVLKTIVERADLKKTRDLLRIARKVTRAVWNNKDNPYLIMPWHIPEMKGYEDIIFKGLESYKIVFTDSVEKSAKNFSHPELAKCVLRSIFLKTYPYDQKAKSDVFPNKTGVALMTYEPDFFSKARLNPPAVMSFLQVLEGDVRVQYLYDDEGVFWFYRTRGIRECILKEQENIYNTEINSVKNKFAEYVEVLSKGGRIGTKKIDSPRALYAIKAKGITVLRENEELSEDFDDYTLVFLSYPVRLTESTSRTDHEYLRIKNMIFKAGKNMRSNKNTVIVSYSTSEEKLKDCFRNIAGILACEKVAKDPRGYVEDIEDEDAVAYYRNRAEKFKDEFIDKLIRAVFSAYEYVAYPEYEDNQDVVGIYKMQTGANTLTEAVMQTLEHPSVQKFIRDIKSFASLRDVLKEKQNIDLEEGIREYRVGEIFDKFIKHPGMPIADEKDLDVAIKEGVRELRIGIVNENDRLFFKKPKKLVNGKLREKRDAGVVPDTIKREFRILPYKLAVERFVEEIRKETEQEGEIVEYKIPMEDGFVSLEDILSQPEWEETVLYSPIIKEVKPIKGPRVKLALDPAVVSGKPGDLFEINVKLLLEEPDGKGKTFKVMLAIEKGEVREKSFDLKHGDVAGTIWKVNIPEGSGSLFLPIKAMIDGEEKARKDLKIGIDTGVVVTDEIKSEYMGNGLLKITGIKDEYCLERISIVCEQFRLPEPKANGSLSCRNGGIIEISLQGAFPRKALELFRVVKTLKNYNMELDINFAEMVKLEEVLIRQLQMLNGKVKFHIKEK